MLRIDYFVLYCVVTVINILWTGGLFIATHMRLNDIERMIEGDYDE
jgi:hypothetical protein